MWSDATINKRYATLLLCITDIKHLPMKHDSSLTSDNADIKTKIMKTPSEFSLNFIKQYARVCSTLKGTNFSNVIVN